jgi:hypothetical protein
VKISHSQKNLNIRCFLAMVDDEPWFLLGGERTKLGNEAQGVEMSKEFASAGLTAGQLDAIVEKLGGF